MSRLARRAACIRERLSPLCRDGCLTDGHMQVIIEILACSCLPLTLYSPVNLGSEEAGLRRAHEMAGKEVTIAGIND